MLSIFGLHLCAEIVQLRRRGVVCGSAIRRHRITHTSGGRAGHKRRLRQGERSAPHCLNTTRRPGIQLPAPSVPVVAFDSEARSFSPQSGFTHSCWGVRTSKAFRNRFSISPLSGTRGECMS
jgi:hypothetical protein